LGTRLLLNWIRTVPVMCGGFCAVRDIVVRDNLLMYLDGYQGIHIGDDRHLALMANVSGHVVVAHKARSYTATPHRLVQLIRQRLRWCRGFYLGVAWTAQHTRPSARLWWVMAYSAVSAVVSIVLVGWMLIVLSQLTIGDYATMIAVLAWMRSYRYLAEDHPKPGRQYVSWLLAPASLLFGLVVLVPVQIVALVTCRRGSWLTR
jgi:cellulose synthase/poly-beta-1,6-N-acetylglucosamine synthase-like glycosyltransferase